MRFYQLDPARGYRPAAALHPHVDEEDPAPFAVYFSIRAEEDGAAVWLRARRRANAEPRPTGETLHFGPIAAGFAKLASAEAKPEPKSATLTVRLDSLGTEALFAFADGSFWRRHFNARFTRTGADLILWVFDAHGTRARTWRGSALHGPTVVGKDGREPT